MLTHNPVRGRYKIALSLPPCPSTINYGKNKIFYSSLMSMTFWGTPLNIPSEVYWYRSRFERHCNERHIGLERFTNSIIDTILSGQEGHHTLSRIAGTILPSSIPFEASNSMEDSKTASVQRSISLRWHLSIQIRVAFKGKLSLSSVPLSYYSTFTSQPLINDSV